MGLRVPIPKELAHLKVDERGYPIPFFVPIIEGKENFRLLSLQKRQLCFDRHLCAICGKKLYKDFSYVISGPEGLKNKVATDSPMHRVCAEFALAVCPHLYFEKAERKLDEVPAFVAPKAKYVYLVKISKWKPFVDPHTQTQFFNFWPDSFETYVYQDGILIKE